MSVSDKIKKFYLYILLVLSLIFLALNIFSIYKAFLYNFDDAFVSKCGRYDRKEMLIGGEKIKLDVADDKCKIELGLSGTKSLENNRGMVFIPEKEGNYGFWMKEMNFTIDIVWVDSNFNIVGIEKSLKPDTYPNVFGEKYLSKYILELSFGFCDKNNVVVGNKIYFL
jgi:uncharacterized membrane protein (UPF0127 family)